MRQWAWVMLGGLALGDMALCGGRLWAEQTPTTERVFQPSGDSNGDSATSALSREAFGLRSARPAEGYTSDALNADDSSGASSAFPAAAFENEPLHLAILDEPRGVYPEIMPPQQEQGINAGGVHFDLDFAWMTRYVYRGIDQSTIPGRAENAEQFNGTADFDLGKLPHPFIGLFANIFSNDPVSRFQEVRPYFGAAWTVKPLTFTGGFISYIYPNRKSFDTQEVFAQISFDDSLLFHSEHPLISPYVYGAYDLDKYQGFYLEAGVSHDFVFEDGVFTLTPYGKIAYVIGQPYFALGPGLRDYGLQHYEIGLTGSLSLNHMFNLGHRFGDWSVEGYLRYTDGIDNHLRAGTLIWGGVGLSFKY